jgi:putative protease
VADKQVGTVSHFYDKIGVAVVELTAALKAGDKIKISSEDQEFEQDVQSMQVEHKQIDAAKKGQSIGLKVDEAVKKGAAVYKV